MGFTADSNIIDALARHAAPLQGDSDLDALVADFADRRIVLMGEASHGTADYYHWRDRLTRRLISEHGFSFVAVEGDWPDCRGIDHYVHNLTHDPAATFDAFARWPTWMWANEEVESFANWLRAFNATTHPDDRASFYGLDVYSLWESLEAVLAYVRTEGVAAREAAYAAANCFEPYGNDERAYAETAALVPRHCRDDVVELLVALRTDASRADDDAFSAEQNARVVQNAEHYYRTMLEGGAPSWNVRDRHMAETLDRLMERHGPDAKGIVWAHNTHVGDARATDMARMGMTNLGQLMRERRPAREVRALGFGSHSGDVIAARAWESPMRVMPVPPAPLGTWEWAFHQATADDRLLFTHDVADVDALKTPIGHRAIGVVYDPTRDPRGQFVPSVIPRRYDAFIHIDESHALHPLSVRRDPSQVPETYPFGA